MTQFKENPFKQDSVARSAPEACTLVIFGATGDLTHRKLIPALYNLAVNGDLPPGTRVIGFARREMTDQEYRDNLKEVAAQVSRSPIEDSVWDSFASSITYLKSEFTDQDGYIRLEGELKKSSMEFGGKVNCLFYFAASPQFFEEIVYQIKRSGLNHPIGGGWTRIIVEKPFGRDYTSAHHLNKILGKAFEESSIYRIDHYLGKETAQNIMILRFANLIFEPIWNSQFVDHIEITCAEDLGMEGGRGAYYDGAGALRDMVQNHLLQLLALVAMEPPTDLSANGVRDEKVKIFRSLRPFKTVREVNENTVRAQYVAGAISGKPVPGYREEDRVNPESDTESYVALRLWVDTWRWAGVPFFMRMGKRLAKKTTEISIHFKMPPNVLFNAMPDMVESANVLVIRIQPNEGISFRMVSKMPGAVLRVEPVKMDFSYATSFGKGSPEAYERLLLDAMSGDATLFARHDEVETAWKFIDYIENAWHSSDVRESDRPSMDTYVAGSWGPKQADALLATTGHAWRRL